MTNHSGLRLAILDLYNKEKNQGMRAIKEIVETYKGLEYEVFDVRAECQLPDTSFDIYISSGGPGDPLEGDGIWDKAYYDFIDKLWLHNQTTTGTKKFVFFICHSFQMACHHFKLANICARPTRSFGTFPVFKTEAGQQEPCFSGLKDQFWVADFRNFQVVEPDQKRIKAIGAKILCTEKPRADASQERAIMAVRFSEEFFGTQFHPEADPKGMIFHFSKEAQKKEIVDNFGLEKYQQMIQDLRDDSKIPATHSKVIPSFLDHAIQMLQLVDVGA